MPALALREFECILCRRQFTLLTQDLILPWTLICDECLAKIWGLEEDALAEFLAAARPVEVSTHTEVSLGSPAPPRPFQKEITAHLQGMKQRWVTVQEAIRARELEWRAFGQDPEDTTG